MFPSKVVERKKESQYFEKRFKKNLHPQNSKASTKFWPIKKSHSKTTGLREQLLNADHRLNFFLIPSHSRRPEKTSCSLQKSKDSSQLT